MKFAKIHHNLEHFVLKLPTFNSRNFKMSCIHIKIQPVCQQNCHIYFDINRFIQFYAKKASNHICHCQFIILYVSFPDADSKNMLFYFQSFLFLFFAKVYIFAHTKKIMWNLKNKKLREKIISRDIAKCTAKK